MNINSLRILILLFLLTISLNAKTQEHFFTAPDPNCPPNESIIYRGITIRLENDSFAKTDRNYSHGLTFTAESHDLKNYSQTECLTLALRLYSKFLKLITPDFWIPNENIIPSSSLVVKLGQSIFTPKDAANPDLILNDRPYAGILYVGFSLHQRYYSPENNMEILDAREITVGVIGPWSFAKEFQDGVHTVLGDEKFQGWSHQLHNEPAGQLAFDKKFKSYRGSQPMLHGFTGDLIRSAGVRIGNIETSANLGVEVRIGWDIPNDFGSFTIRPGTDSRPPDVLPVRNNATENSKSNSPHFGFHLFTIIDLKLTAYSFSIDGNLSQSSHRVTREPVVAFGAFGLSFPTIIKKRGYNLAIMQVYQSSDFKEQSAHHSYRSVALSIEF